MSRDISTVLTLALLAGILLTVGSFTLGYTMGRTDGRYTERCMNLGGRVLRDGTCGNETVSHIDAGNR